MGRVRWGAALLLLAVLIPGVSSAHRGGKPHAGTLRHGSYDCARIDSRLPSYRDWPRVDSRIRDSKKLEARVKSMLSKLSLEEKVGQMTQPEISAITPAEVQQYYIGSVLNGGGSWPGANKHATQADWLALADAYWAASKAGNVAGVPAIWGIDAVHGNSNVFGATLFPHNIGLGAAHDPCLVRDVEAATARAVRATGRTGPSRRPWPSSATTAGAAPTRASRRIRASLAPTATRRCSACRATTATASARAA